ncbi:MULTISPECIES: PE-PGRS family protein [unclassified Streptomyces]|uniref:WXG100-like domain-containing protein n=1 Tax=unclassified Streptomyces TaxID=2593676 RepID=UPI003BB70588
MALTLPDEVAWVLDLLGYSWPDADEDKIHEAAEAWRQFATAVRDTQNGGTSAASAVLGSNSGDAAQGFEDAWKKFSGGGGGYLDDAAMAAEILAFALDAVALIVVASKIAVIAQLIALAFEIAAAQAAAPVTFGLSEIGAAGATQATRLIVRRILDELKQKLIQQVTQAVEQQAVQSVKEIVLDVVKEAAVEAGKAAGQNLLQQGVQNHFGAQDGMKWGEAAVVGAGTFASETVNGAAGAIDEASGRFGPAGRLVGGAASAGLGAVGEGIGEGVHATGEGVGQGAGAAAQGIVDSTAESLPGAGEAVTEALDPRSMVSSPGEAAQGAVDGAVEGATGAVGDAAQGGLGRLRGEQPAAEEPGGGGSAGATGTSGRTGHTSGHTSEDARARSVFG